MADKTWDDVWKLLATGNARQTLKAGSKDTYQEVLADIPMNYLYQAAVHAVKTRYTFPSIAELREFAVDKILCLPTEDVAMQQVEEWAKFRPEGSGPSKKPNPIVLKSAKFVGDRMMWRESTRPQQMRSDFRRKYQKERSGVIAKWKPSETI